MSGSIHRPALALLGMASLLFHGRNSSSPRNVPIPIVVIDSDAEQ
jgi:hypothetical protein